MATIWKPTMRASPPGAIGAGRRPACAIVSAPRRSCRPTARFCSASWARTPPMPGRIYFPCGTPDPSDIVDGRVDLDFSVRRELKEETGLDMPNSTPEPGWTMVCRRRADRANQGFAVERIGRPICARAFAHILPARRGRNSPISVSSRPGDFDPAMPGYATAFMASRFARG